jgi:hypothetical protein
MAARKRKQDEDFKTYRFNLKNEAFADKVKLTPKVFYNKGTYQKIV